MENINIEELDNFISVQLGIKFTLEGVQDFVCTRLRQKHNEIKQKLKIANCNINCSGKYGCSFKHWCQSCRIWKAELYSLNRYSRHWDYIEWQKLDSTKIAQKYEEMTKVFIKDFHIGQQKLLLDLSSILSLVKNMKIFNFSDHILTTARQVRNKYIAHNNEMILSNAEKQFCFSILKSFLQTQQIRNETNVQRALRCITILNSSSGIPVKILRSQEGRQIFEYVINNSLELARANDLEMFQTITAPFHVDDFEQFRVSWTQTAFDNYAQRLGEIALVLDKNRRYQMYRGPKPKLLKHFFVLFFIIFSAIYGYLSYQRENAEDEGCLSMRFDGRWGHDTYAHFDWYVERLFEESSTSRKWLKYIISDKLKSEHRGVLLTAEMGYGKSTIVSNMICAEKYSPWIKLRKRILTYQFCRHDSFLSKSASLFVKNIAYAIVHRYPELGQFILSDDMASRLFQDLQCSDDPVNCLEIGIISPLRQKWKHYSFFIIIDALDECDHEGNNAIMKLLFRSLEKFPPNIKFIVTTRKIENIIHKLRQFALVDLDSYYENNNNDIAIHIQQQTDLSINEIKSLINQTHANFLLINIYLEHCKQSGFCNFRDVPETLQKVYEINFDRIFGHRISLFEDIRPVFEVLCTLTNPLTEKQILAIANITCKNKKRKIEVLLGNELGHFLRITLEKLSFLHKSISDFLTDTSRRHELFFISKENGHALFAEYLLANINALESQEIVELVHHIALSGNISNFKHKLSYLGKTLIQNTNVSAEWYIHYCVKNFNSYQTTSFILDLISRKYINKQDKRQMSPAFVAAAHGNEESLKCLIDNGGDPTFKVVFPYYLVVFGQELVDTCKYIHFCGYTILHIASQNGHLEVVQYLLNHYDHLTHIKNDMNLNAFQLAAENGRFGIVDMFLKKNKNLSDSLSLHHASKNGHFTIARHLVQRGVKDNCLPCNGSMYWIPALSNRQQQEIKISRLFSSIETSFYDDWHLITCENALHAAVRNGYFKIVRLLTENEMNGLECKTFDGKTPILTALQSNEVVIANNLLQMGSHILDSCYRPKILSLEIKWKLSLSEIYSINLQQCPVGATFVHFLAINNNLKFFWTLYRSMDYTWDAGDAEGLTPLHYAFCHSSIDFIKAMKEISMDFHVRSLNGSTPYHSGAVCRSLSVHHVIYEMDIVVPDLFDYKNRSILQYAALAYHSPDDTPKYDLSFEIHFEIAKFSNHDFHHIDAYGRNFLHYAAKSGNFFAFSFAEKEPKVTNLTRLIIQKDENGFNPFDMLFHSMKKRIPQQLIEMPIDCTNMNLFSSPCQERMYHIVSPHERSIVEVSKYLSKIKGISNFNMTTLIQISIRKLRTYPILVLNNYFKAEFRSAIETTPALKVDLTDFEGPNLIESVLSQSDALDCNGGISPLHITIMNKRNQNWQYAHKTFLDTFLRNLSAEYLDWCFDKEGFNLLHRAIMGGNVFTTKYLLKKGMDIAKKTRKDKSAISLSVIHSPYLFREQLPLIYKKSSGLFVFKYVSENASDFIAHSDKGVVDFDETAATVLNETFASTPSKINDLKHWLCPNKTDNLGLVQIATAKGLIQFLKTSKSLFGVDILKCIDYNNISAINLAILYNQTHVVKWMHALQVTESRPNPEVQSVLLYNVVSNYRTIMFCPWNCRLQYSHRFPGFFRNVVKKCITFCRKQEIMHKNPQKKNTINSLHLTLSFLDAFWEKTSIHHEIKLFCLKNYIDVCSENMKITNLHRSLLSEVIRSATVQLQHMVLFGNDDFIFVFKNLMKHLGLQPYISPSFNSVLSFRYSYLSDLTYHDSLHKSWLTANMGLFENYTIVTYIKDSTSIALTMLSTLRFRKNRDEIHKVEKEANANLQKYTNIVVDDVLNFWRNRETLADLLNLEFYLKKMYVENGISLKTIADLYQSYTIADSDVSIQRKYRKAKHLVEAVLKRINHMPIDKKKTMQFPYIVGTGKAFLSITE